MLVPNYLRTYIYHTLEIRCKTVVLIRLSRIDNEEDK